MSMREAYLTCRRGSLPLRLVDIRRISCGTRLRCSTLFAESRVVEG